ncbi:hypothetical protein AOLI_G00101840 [Acnodon oligacanthus]
MGPLTAASQSQEGRSVSLLPLATSRHHSNQALPPNRGSSANRSPCGQDAAAGQGLHVDPDRDHGVHQCPVKGREAGQGGRALYGGVPEDKVKQREIRDEAILKTQNKAAENAKAKATKIQQEKKYTLETMMKLEEEERARIQTMKDEECARATAELEAWKEKQRKTAEEEEARRMLQGATTQADKQVPKQRKPEKAAQTPSRTEGRINSGKKDKQKDLPAPRSVGCIKISFTPRVFPTALRESRVPEEEEWLRKQAEARRMASADLAQLDDLKEEEKNTDWLKDKGDHFFRAGNYQAAVNAYDLAIKLNRRIPSLFSNRAACHLKLRNLHKAIEDSSQALELLTPAVADNAAARLRAHVRRGTAFCELELYIEGLQDYQAALKIDPNNQALQADASKIREIVQGMVPSS